MSLVREVPEWAKGIVWYQIYPERFRNGNTSIGPKVTDQINSYPHDTKSPWQLHPWYSDWYELQSYEQKNKLTLWENLHRRRYGGDLLGIIHKLDYLKDLGVGGLYLNPVFMAPSHHKYDAASYHHIDPTFGPDPEGDRKKITLEQPENPNTWVWTEADKLFLRLIREVHQRGMKIIIDGVFNHVGLNFWAFQDVKHKQKHSAFASWFKIVQWDDSETGKEFAVRTWEGFRELPEWKESRMGPVKGPKKYIFDITRRWMDPHNDGDAEAGIDGWRLDVAHDIKHQFWKDWRKHVRSIKSDAFLTGEVICSIPEQKTFLQGDEFDSVMNYHFAFAAFSYFLHENRLSTSAFTKQLTTLLTSFPPDIVLSLQNLYGSHDTNRVLSHIKNRDLFDNYNDWGRFLTISRAENPRFDTTTPTIEDIQRYQLLLLFQFAFPGAPMLYYGDEYGMWGANDPCCRKPMMWPDVACKHEQFLPNQSLLTEPNEVVANENIHALMKKLAHIRNEFDCLQLGNFEFVEELSSEKVYSFKRIWKNQSMLVMLNRSSDSQYVTLSESFKELLHNTRTDKHTKIELPAFSGGYFVKE